MLVEVLKLTISDTFITCFFKLFESTCKVELGWRYKIRFIFLRYMYNTKNRCTMCLEHTHTRKEHALST